MKSEKFSDQKFSVKNINESKKNIWKKHIISMKNMDEKQLFMQDLSLLSELLRLL
jgi:hypothetical protein